MSVHIKVLGLGPGDAGLMPSGAIEIMKGAKRVFLRTGLHPAVAELSRQGVKFETFDHFYDTCDNFEDVYESMVQFLLTESGSADTGYFVFAVPGHPLVAEAAVRELMQRRPDGVEIIPAMSFLDIVFARLGVDPADGLQVLDACNLQPERIDTAAHLFVCQVYSSSMASEVKLKLMECYPDDYPIVVVRAAGVPGEEKIANTALFELDRLFWIDHLTSVYVPPGPEQARKVHSLEPLMKVMGRLLSPEGCPWDRAQTPDTLKRYLIEETFEVIDAIEAQDVHKLCEELGDLLLQIVFHAELARHEGSFDINDVVDGITRKMIRRHPHVFGTTKVSGTEQVLVNWDKIKAEERGENQLPGSYLENIPRQLPSLMVADKIQGKVSLIGFDWPNVEGAWDKVKEEMAELTSACRGNDALKIKEEMGDLLFAVVNVARLLSIDPEEALRMANRKFCCRFQYIEQMAAARGKNLEDMSLDEMDSLWLEAKTREK